MTAAAVLLVMQVVAVSVDVTLEDGGAVVSTHYRIRSNRDSVAFHAMRYGIAPIGSLIGSYPVELEETAGTYRFAIPVLARRVNVRYIYHVGGDGTRIPIFVPDHATDPDLTREIRIRVIGRGDNVAEGDGFPRWSRHPDGTLVATPANVPSFLHLPRADGPVPVSRIADLTVVALVVLGTLWWVGGRIRASRSPRPAAT